jgi:zinc protease
MRALLAAMVLAGTTAALAADTPSIPGTTTFTIDDGLTVVVRPDHERPVVAVQMLYRVGARNEAPGQTGIAHFVEHMLFRGTPRFGLADITGVIERAGGEWHGYTTLDCTTYFEAAPRDLLPTLVSLEAERMHAARLAADEVEAERGAVFQEYRGYQLDPRSDLFDAVMALLFLQHPYRNNTMGWESDLSAITHADLVAFYRRFYGPRNAVLAIDGDFEPREAERLVREAFRGIPAGGDDTALRTVEPEPQGPRRLTLLRPGARPAVEMSFPAPAPSQPRPFAAFLVADALLGKARGLSFLRQSGDLGTGAAAPAGSPLAALVEQGLVREAGAALVPTQYPYAYSIFATAAEGQGTAAIEEAVFATLRRLENSDDAAIEAAVRRIRAVDRVETDSPVERAHEMAYWTAIGGLDRRDAVLHALDDMSHADVHAALRTLVPERAAIGWVLPAEPPLAAPPSGSAGRDQPRAVAPAMEPVGIAARAAGERVATVSLDGGGRAIVDARPRLRTFTLRLALRAGSWDGDPQLERELESGGIDFEVLEGGGSFADRDVVQLAAAGPAESLTAALRAMTAALRRPAPPAKSGDGGEALPASPAARAYALLDRATRMSGAAAQHWELAIVSTSDEKALSPWLQDLGRAIGARLAAAPGSRVGEPHALLPGRDRSDIPGLVQGRLLLAVPGDADPVVQEAVAWILHHNYSGRLGVKAIAETGLVYDMDSESVRGKAPLVDVIMGADPGALDRLDQAMAAECDRARGDIGEAEVAAFRSDARGRLAVRLADPAQAARLWLRVLRDGFDHTQPEREATRAQRLTLDEVRAAATRMLDPARRRVIVIGR